MKISAIIVSHNISTELWNYYSWLRVQFLDRKFNDHPLHEVGYFCADTVKISLFIKT